VTNYKKITKVETKIVEARNEGLSIGQLNEVDFINDILNALISISAITGHSLPEEQFIAKRLNEELRTQLLDYGYSDLTMAEIVLAFRLNCLCNLKYPSGSEVISTEIFGRFINVDYITKVLNTYRTLRMMLDNQLKNIIDGY